MSCHHDDFPMFPTARVGHPAPDFDAVSAYLPDGSFGKISLSDYRGKWVVLFFYPLDFTFVCPTEIKEMSRRAAEFRERGVEVLFASVDSEHSHKAWVERGDLGEMNWPMLADLNKEISEAYGVLHDDGMSLRGAFLIDDEGVLRSAIVNDLPVGRDVDEILRLVDAFQTGELCPVGFHQGDKTLGKA